MAAKRHKPEEIVTKLRQVEVLVGQGMDGFELARELRGGYPHISILLTSGFPGMSPNKDDIDSTEVTLLRKPYRKAGLAEAVLRIFDQ